MRIDHRTASLPMTREQHFFTAVWHNMVHKHSLDSYRVRALNPQNGLRELLRMCHPPANGEDLTMVATEVASIISSDPILCFPEFIEPTSELLEILSPNTPQNKQIEKVKPLIQTFAKELLQKIIAQYVPTALFWLKQSLEEKAGPPGPLSKKFLHDIHLVTGNLLSSLLDNGASIESLFALYREVITGVRNKGKAYVFDNRLSLLEKLLTKLPATYTVVFSVDGIGDATAFPANLGPVQFVPSVNNMTAPTAPVKRYLLTNPKRLFAVVEVKTKDFRSAGTQAYELINNVLDLVRFEYESNCLHLANDFLIAAAAPLHSYRIYSIPKVVPNPSTAIAATQLQEFAKSVDELFGGREMSIDGRDRIQSAFRLYRVGADTNIFENKLTSWWTATEYLVKGSSGTGSIGKAVEDTLAPVLCLRYIQKLLFSFRDTLVDLKANITDPLTASPILLKDIDGQQLYSLFRNHGIKTQLLAAAAADPFFHMKLEEFLAEISSPNLIWKMLTSHEQRLRWHIQRIYRARCDIVHSAERVVNAALLCANLEFYLKSTLTSLLNSLTNSPHISGPKEFFDRQGYSYKRMVEELKQNVDKRLLATL